MSHTVEKVLIGRALEGDQCAFTALYKTYHPRIYGMIAPRTTDQDDAEDMVQVTFVKAFQALNSFRGESAFSTWLTRIALNVYHSHLREQWIRKERFEEVPEIDLVPHVDRGRVQMEDPEETFYRKKRQSMVLEGIASLPGHYRKAMWLRYVKELSYREITQELQVPMGTVKTWLCRGRRQLKGEFERREVWAM